MSSSAPSKVQSALQPKNMYSPFGNLTNTKKSSTFTPNFQPGQKELMGALPSNENDIVRNLLPQATHDYANNVHNLTADNLVNPQVYDAMYGLQSTPLLTNYHNQQNALNNTLAAQNLTGGSADVMANNLLRQDLGTQLGQAANQSVLSGLGATGDYLGWQGNALGHLGDLATQYQNLSSGLQTQLMSPFGMYTNYQQTLNPLQQQQASYQAQTPTGFQQVMGGIGGAMNAVVPGLGGGFVGMGNAFGNPYASSQFPYAGTGQSAFGSLMGSGGGGGGGQQLATNIAKGFTP